MSLLVFFLFIRLPPSATLTYTLFPDTTRFLSTLPESGQGCLRVIQCSRVARRRGGQRQLERAVEAVLLGRFADGVVAQLHGQLCHRNVAAEPQRVEIGRAHV